MKRLQAVFFGLVVASVSTLNALACGDYCGDYSAMWGGGCGSLTSSCVSGYDSVGLYGNDWAYGYTPSFDIQINLDFSYLSGYSAHDGLGCFDLGCSIGYCSSPGGMGGFPSITGLDPTALNPSYFDFPGLTPGLLNPYLPAQYPMPQVPGTVLSFPGNYGYPGYPYLPPSYLSPNPSNPYLPTYPSYPPYVPQNPISPVNPVPTNPVFPIPNPSLMSPQNLNPIAPNFIPSAPPVIGNQPGLQNPVTLPVGPGTHMNPIPPGNGGNFTPPTPQVIPLDPNRGRVPRGARRTI